ncbi:Low affinity immunoglobulin epsilon Fc receptor, partial [Orchesella cincta]
GASINLIALGTVDGKTFFADTTQRNWTAARTYCSGMGMRLAEITSKAQWDLLASAHNTTTFQQDHWTAARDSHTSRQFTWDGSLSEPSETFGEWRNTHEHGNKQIN